MNRSQAGKLGYEVSKKKLLAHSQQRSQKALNKYLEAPKNCKDCNTQIPYDQRANKFCSQSCSAKTNNKKRLTKKCLNCKSLIYSARTYCSQTCQHELLWNEKVAQTEKTGIVASKNSHFIKKFLSQKYGRKCVICECSKWMDKRLVMILDHINGDPYDWRLINLRQLCPNCDSQTDTWKSKNIGNGRHSRRKRYKEGKSY